MEVLASKGEVSFIIPPLCQIRIKYLEITHYLYKGSVNDFFCR